MVGVVEYDALFIDDRSVTAYEFTVRQDVKKAREDATKIATLLQGVLGQAENRYKAALGKFVTQQEPTAEQRRAVQAVADAYRVQLVCQSFTSLQSALLNTETYIRLRRQAPFGSSAYVVQSARGDGSPLAARYVKPNLSRAADGSRLGIEDVADHVARGERLVVTADYGAGKSELLRNLFELRRSRYFRNAAEQRFPLHLNLNDFYALRSPMEILRRHAESIGFGDPAGLISAWRAGSCDLLLDGFDELVPSRWAGNARDLAQVRWSALEPVRRLVRETPEESSVVVVGRPQYFASSDELSRTLGMEGAEELHLQDFSAEQVRELLNDTSVEVPSWLPARPLLLKLLFGMDLLGSLSTGTASEAHSWHSLISLLADREASRITSMLPETIRALMARIGTHAVTNGGASARISMDAMRGAFREVCGYDAEEEGLLLLMRLPGLVAANGDPGAPVGLGYSATEEERVFVDDALMAAAYGLDLAAYVAAPYAKHPLGEASRDANAAPPLSSAVAGVALSAASFDANAVWGAVQQRMNANLFDATLFDVVQMSANLQSVPGSQRPFVSDVAIPSLTIRDEVAYAAVTLKGCIIDVLDMLESEQSSTPIFEDCLIARVEGWSSVPAEYALNFIRCEVEAFSDSAQTNAALNNLALDLEARIALVVLRKVYAQQGKGRRLSALPRGMAPHERGEVPGVVRRLQSQGWVESVTFQGEELVVPLANRRADVTAILANPASVDRLL